MQAEQLSLLDLVAEAESFGREPGPNIVDALLDYHHGDCRAAMHELLLDADFLREQLYTASRMLSSGMGRGWKPKYERV